MYEFLKEHEILKCEVRSLMLAVELKVLTLSYFEPNLPNRNAKLS